MTSDPWVAIRDSAVDGFWVVVGPAKAAGCPWAVVDGKTGVSVKEGEAADEDKAMAAVVDWEEQQP